MIFRVFLSVTYSMLMKLLVKDENLMESLKRRDQLEYRAFCDFLTFGDEFVLVVEISDWMDVSFSGLGKIVQMFSNYRECISEGSRFYN